MQTLYIQGGSDKSGIVKIFLETHTEQLKIVKKNLQTYILRSVYAMKWLSAATTASTQTSTFATVSLSRDPITAFIFCIRSSIFCEALHWPINQRRPTWNIQKVVIRQTAFFSHTSSWFSFSYLCVLFLLLAWVPSSRNMQWLFSYT